MTDKSVHMPAFIPLIARSGDFVCGAGALRDEAIVDDEDYAALAQHVWVYDGIAGYARCGPGSAKALGYNLMHRAIMKAPRGMVVHHVNGDRRDNRRINLVVMTPREHTEVHRKHRFIDWITAPTRVVGDGRVKLYARDRRLLGVYPRKRAFELLRQLQAETGEGWPNPTTPWPKPTPTTTDESEA